MKDMKQLIIIIVFSLSILGMSSVKVTMAMNDLDNPAYNRGYEDGCMQLLPFSNATDGNHHSLEYVKGFAKGVSLCDIGLRNFVQFASSPQMLVRDHKMFDYPY
jgi:hypothetical protein